MNEEVVDFKKLMEDGNKKSEKKAKKERKPNMRLRNAVFTVTIIIVLYMLACAVTPKSFQNDTFYNIKVGEYINQNGVTTDVKDPFSIHDINYSFPHWLYDWFVYLIFNAWGYTGIYVATMIVYGTIGMCSYLLMKNKTKNRVVSAVAAIFVVYMLETYMAARAQSVTYVLFLLEMLVVIEALFCGGIVCGPLGIEGILEL